MSEAIEIAQDVARKLIESYREHGDILPKGLQAINTENVEDVRCISLSPLNEVPS